MKNHKLNRIISGTIGRMAMVSAVQVMALCASKASAQESPRKSEPAGTSTLDEIVVTAQRRSENLQKVPISVSAVSATQINNAGVQTAQDLQQVVPGLVYNRSTLNASPFLRGIGRISSTPGVEFPVAQYVDGIYQASSAGTLTSLNNVERVEVLKGPQGTLFGRNATGGLINIVTRDPQHAFSYDSEVGYGNYGTSSAKLYVTDGVTDTLAADLAISYQNQHDGWGFNATTGNDVRKNRDFAIRSKSVWNPTDRTKITGTIFYTISKGDVGNYALAPGARGLNGLGNTGFYDFQDPKNFISVENRGVSARVDQELGFAKLVNITAYQKAKGTTLLDADGLAAQIIRVDFDFKQNTLSNETQLLSRANNRFKWILGFFYLNDRAAAVSTFGGSGFPTGQLIDNAHQKTTSYAPFLQTTLNVTNSTRITAGARYTKDKISIAGTEVNALGAQLFNIDQSAAFSKVTYRLAIDHDLSNHVLVYASYNRGFKSAGYSLQAATQAALKPEVLDAYEVGLKAELFNRRVRTNVAAFYYNYKDMIVRSNNPLTNKVQDLNAAASTIKGVDFDGQIALSHGLIWTVGAEYLDAKYDSFPGAPITTRRPTGGNVVLVGDAAGMRLSGAPEWSFITGLQYEARVGNSRLQANVNNAYTSKIFFSPDNRFRQPGKNILNANLTYFPGDKGIRLQGWVRNLLDTKYVQAAAAQTVAGDLISPGAPRTYGLTAGYKF